MDANEIMLKKVEIYPFKVISHDGDIYTLMAECFKHDAGGFAFYIGKQKVAWFDMGIVKAVSIMNTEEWNEG